MNEIFPYILGKRVLVQKENALKKLQISTSPFRLWGICPISPFITFFLSNKSLRDAFKMWPCYLMLILRSCRLVIMNLVSISNGKSQHVPYRDSKLTFLLQVE